MPKLATPLSEAQIEEFVPKTGRYKVSDGKNLCLVIEPSGTKRWHFSFKRFGKHSTMSFGTYPAVSLSDARTQREQAIQLIKGGIDPVNQRREQILQERAVRPAAPILHISMNEHGAMIIENKNSRIILSIAQVAALKAFLSATNNQEMGE
jgi:hypothetical protein